MQSQQSARRMATKARKRRRKLQGKESRQELLGYPRHSWEPLFGALRSIGSANAQGEYYLPDLVRIYRERGLEVETLTVDDPREIMGVNSRRELADVEAILKTTRNDELMAAGVSIVDPATAWIGPDVEIGPDTILHPNVYLEGRTRIGARCEIHAGVRIVDSTIDDGAVINNYCVITESHIRSGARIGPFAHLRALAVLPQDRRAPLDRDHGVDRVLQHQHAIGDA